MRRLQQGIRSHKSGWVANLKRKNCDMTICGIFFQILTFFWNQRWNAGKKGRKLQKHPAAIQAAQWLDLQLQTWEPRVFWHFFQQTGEATELSKKCYAVTESPEMGRPVSLCSWLSGCYQGTVFYFRNSQPILHPLWWLQVVFIFSTDDLGLQLWLLLGGRFLDRIHVNTYSTWPTYTNLQVNLGNLTF